MGLLDVLNGMQNGPRGQPQPATRGAAACPKSQWLCSRFLRTRPSKA